MNLEQKFDWKIQKLERAWNQDTEDLELSLRLAEAYFQKGYYLGKGDPWFDLAIERVSEVIERGMATSETCTLLANALYGRHEYDAAGQAYQRSIELDPLNALAHVGLGNLEKRRGDFQKARECFQRAVEISPTLWQAHYNLGGAYHQQARVRGSQGSDALIEKAIFHLVRALRLGPFENFVPNIHKDLGELFLQTRQYNHARRFFNRLTDHDRYAPLAQYYLGLTHYSLGKYTLAIQNYRNFLKYEPRSALAWSKIGLTYLDLKQYPRAREACAHALELEPDNVLARFTIGCTYLDQRDFREAIRAFEAVLERAPDYFPAYVELVKAHYLGKDSAWLAAELGREIDAFNAADGYDGGRGYYRGTRGAHRHRIDVLMAQMKDIGAPMFPSLLAAIHRIQCDSLRYQVWEEVHQMAQQAKVDQVLVLLREVENHFSADFGKTVLALSQFLPEEAVMAAFRTEDERLKRAARSRVTVRDDIGAYLRELDSARSDFQEFQGYLLRSLAVKGSADAERFLVEALGRPERGLKLSAAIALVYYGNERALDFLQQEAEGLDGPSRDRVQELIRVGKEKHDDLSRVIHLRDLHDRGRLRDLSAPRRNDNRAIPSTCAVCNRGQREVERMLAGSRLMICTSCVQDLWQERDLLRSTEDRDLYCSFCRKSVFEVDTFYARKNLLMCNLCLELCMSVLEQEEVDRFLEGLGP